jgi:hypothetical protein
MRYDNAGNGMSFWPWAVIAATSLILVAIVVAFSVRNDRGSPNGKGWIAGDRRVRAFLGSYDMDKLSSTGLIDGFPFKLGAKDALPAREFLSKLLALQDAKEHIYMDPYGRVAANSPLRYFSPSDSRPAATVLVYSHSTQPSIVIYFDDNDADRICIDMTPAVRKAYDTAAAELRKNADAPKVQPANSEGPIMGAR